MDVMIDIETLGTNNHAMILSIGAAKFDFHAPTQEQAVVDTIYMRLDITTMPLTHFVMDAATVLWWLSDERQDARTALLQDEPLPIATALSAFAQWYGPNPMPTWGNGAAFDNVILRNAYEVMGEECPWHYSMDRCFRTLKADVPANALARVKSMGTAHQALHDAVWQARAAWEIRRRQERYTDPGSLVL